MGIDTGSRKRAIRAEIRERRQNFSEDQRKQAALDLADRLNELLTETEATTISCYLSTPTEPGTREFIAGALEKGITIFLPVTRADGLLDWVAATTDGNEIEGLFGIFEPDGEILGPMTIDTADLLIIPAAAISNDGTRLGWGRGYFDKTLESIESRPPVFAVTFDSELFDDLPRDAHDQPVSGVVTPQRIVRFDSERSAHDSSFLKGK